MESFLSSAVFNAESKTFTDNIDLIELDGERFAAEVYGIIGAAILNDLVAPAVALLRTLATRPDLSTALIDALWMWSALIDMSSQKSEWRSLSTVVSELRSSSLVAEDLLRLHLDTQLLVDARLCSRGETVELLGKRLTRVRTTLIFKQQKYNLLREETEGYSRLCAVLAALPVLEPLSESSSQYTSSHPAVARVCTAVLSLIGTTELCFLFSI